MRMNRSVLMDEGRPQVFHVISRVVGRDFIFGDEEKGEFLSYMRHFEAFSGVQILSFCLMDNHFHLLVHVPARPEEISTDEVRNRMKILYGEKRMAELDKEIGERKEYGDERFADEIYDRIRARLYNLSGFVKDLKLRFSKWYNTENDRKGTLWEDRYKSVLVETSESVMMKVSAYIELNSVRAGLVSRPEDYQWCSFAEATAGGSKAQEGIVMIVSGLNKKGSWENASDTYKKYFLLTAVTQNHKKRGISEEEYYQELQPARDDSESEKLGSRLRYLTEGLVIGRQKFLKDFLDSNRDTIGEHRKNPGFRTEKGEDGLYSYRKTL